VKEAGRKELEISKRPPRGMRSRSQGKETGKGRRRRRRRGSTGRSPSTSRREGATSANLPDGKKEPLQRGPITYTTGYPQQWRAIARRVFGRGRSAS